MSIISEIQDDETWDAYSVYLIEQEEDLEDSMNIQFFIKNRLYREPVRRIAEGTYVFSDPIRFEIPKTNGNGVRVIYSFKKGSDVGEHAIIKLIAFLLRAKYESIFADNLYSSTQSEGRFGALGKLKSIKNLADKYIYKGDLTNYGNSIDQTILLKLLNNLLDKHEHDTFELISAILLNKNVLVFDKSEGEYKLSVDLEKGTMTGMPFCGFLSNLFLNDIDWHFKNLGVDYFRFTDDILIVSDTEDEMKDHFSYFSEKVLGRKLILNLDKQLFIRPGGEFQYLGLICSNGKMMISDDVVVTYKKKAKGIAKKYRKRYEMGTMSKEMAFTDAISSLMTVFYGNETVHFNFVERYFPLIDINDRLGEIDRYSQECLRYVYTGKFSRSNASKVPYEMLTDRGYVPLVSAYRIFRYRYHPTLNKAYK